MKLIILLCILALVASAIGLGVGRHGMAAAKDLAPVRPAGADGFLAAIGPVEAVVPAAWTPPQGRRVAIDFALSLQADAWLRDVFLGDPSFDNFRHAANNPMLRGQLPYEWPVNGSFFEDPQSGHWYAYVGNYPVGYGTGPDNPPPSRCTIYRSADQGKSWTYLGPMFPDPKFHFEDSNRQIWPGGEVSVVFDGGRYHMAYDWGAEGTGTAPGENGAAYAWADRPEGPFHRQSTPILRTAELPRRFPLAGKYNRAYAVSLIRRSHDWLALVLTDSGEAFSWGIVALSAPAPQGPWSDPVLVLGNDGNRYFPPAVESFPAFVHDGYVYNPATSVALNRNFQVIYRAKTEQAHRPEAWELYQHGTTWHADPVQHEGLGMWGQTFSGFVDAQGEFQVMFPSREAVSGLGTINFASRPWKQPLRERGFVLNGHEGASLTLLRSAYRGFELEADLTVHGHAARILWGCQAPLGPVKPSSGVELSELCQTRQQQLELSRQQWRIVSVDDVGHASVAAAGPLSAQAAHTVKLALQDSGQAELVIDGQKVWNGRLPVVLGPIGLWVDRHSHLAVERFAVTGIPEPAVFPYLYTAALIGAGEKMTDWVKVADWDVQHSPTYRFGVGAVRKSSGGRVKWNFHGRGFNLWLPKGPEFGRCALLLNGEKLAELDLRSDQSQPSRVLFSRQDLANAYHALVVQPINGRLVVDSLDVLN